eukprot:gene28225-31328_t
MVTDGDFKESEMSPLSPCWVNELACRHYIAKHREKKEGNWVVPARQAMGSSSHCRDELEGSSYQKRAYIPTNTTQADTSSLPHAIVKSTGGISLRNGAGSPAGLSGGVSSPPTPEAKRTSVRCSSDSSPHAVQLPQVRVVGRRLSTDAGCRQSAVSPARASLSNAGAIGSPKSRRTRSSLSTGPSTASPVLSPTPPTTLPAAYRPKQAVDTDVEPSFDTICQLQLPESLVPPPVFLTPLQRVQQCPSPSSPRPTSAPSISHSDPSISHPTPTCSAISPPPPSTSTSDAPLSYTPEYVSRLESMLLETKEEARQARADLETLRAAVLQGVGKQYANSTKRASRASTSEEGVIQLAAECASQDSSHVSALRNGRSKASRHGSKLPSPDPRFGADVFQLLCSPCSAGCQQNIRGASNPSSIDMAKHRYLQPELCKAVSFHTDDRTGLLNRVPDSSSSDSVIHYISNPTYNTSDECCSEVMETSFSHRTEGVWPEVNSTPGVWPEVNSTPGVWPEVNSTPGVWPEVSSTPGVWPEVNSTPGVWPEVNSTPSVWPEVNSTPGVWPEVNSTPGVWPEVNSTPGVWPAINITPGVWPEVKSTLPAYLRSLSLTSVHSDGIPDPKCSAQSSGNAKSHHLLTTVSTPFPQSGKRLGSSKLQPLEFSETVLATDESTSDDGPHQPLPSAASLPVTTPTEMQDANMTPASSISAPLPLASTHASSKTARETSTAGLQVHDDATLGAPCFSSIGAQYKIVLCDTAQGDNREAPTEDDKVSSCHQMVSVEAQTEAAKDCPQMMSIEAQSEGYKVSSCPRMLSVESQTEDDKVSICPQMVSVAAQSEAAKDCPLESSTSSSYQAGSRLDQEALSVCIGVQTCTEPAGEDVGVQANTGLDSLDPKACDLIVKRLQVEVRQLKSFLNLLTTANQSLEEKREQAETGKREFSTRYAFRMLDDLDVFQPWAREVLVMALKNRKSDGSCKGCHTEQDAKWFYDAVAKKWGARVQMISFKNLWEQIMDMVKPAGTNRGFTSSELKKCALGSGVTGLLLNHRYMLTHRSALEWGKHGTAL